MNQELPGSCMLLWVPDREEAIACAFAVQFDGINLPSVFAACS
jgi:hypothetical protein